MKKLDEYCADADECRARAREAGNDDEKTQLLSMAVLWETFAAQRERLRNLPKDL
jgi:hypothetical protein